MLGPWFLSRIRITDPVARGLAVGTTAHGQGTAMMLHEGDTQGALSGVAMALAAIFTSFVAPVVVPWVVDVWRSGGDKESLGPFALSRGWSRQRSRDSGLSG